MSWDKLFVISFLLLIGMGLLVLYGLSAKEADDFLSSVFFKQSIFAAAGIGMAFLMARVDHRYYRVYSTPLYFISIVILAWVIFFGETVRGTVGWIQLPFFQFQPVELAKIVLVIFLASFISQKRAYLSETARLFVSGIFTLVLIALVLMQPDFGSGMVLLGIWGGMVAASGLRKRSFVTIFMLATITACAGWLFLADYQKQRIITVFYPDIDARGSGYNVAQSLVAIGSGGIFGQGIGQGTQSQLNFLPEKHTDFIFASLSESLGFVGVIFLFFILALFLYCVQSMARASQDDFGYLLGVGFFSMFTLQIFVTIGMNVAIFPVTGIPLPFVSYGGSSLITSLLACGILMGISQRRAPEYIDEY